MSQFSEKIKTFAIVSFLGILVTGVLFLGIGGTALFIPESKAVHALETQGFSEIRITEKSWLLIGLRGGDKSDSVRFTAKAKNPVGKEVEVYVFAGYFKGATIRTP